MPEHYLCRDLALTIIMQVDPDRIQLVLRDDLSLSETQLCYPVSNATHQRRYHLREAMVLAVRQLIHQAVTEGLISDSPGGPTSSSKAPSPAWDGQGALTLSMIDLEL
jgi:hypothetical protein